MNITRFAVAVLAFAASSITLAGPPGPYLGVQALHSTLDADIPGQSQTVQDNAFGYKLYGGYRLGVGNFLDNFALEASWQGYGDLEDRVRGGNEVEVDVGGFTGDLLGFIPVSERFQLFGKVGYFDFDSDVSINGIDTGSDNDDGLNFGGGFDSQVGRISVRGDFTWFDVDDADFWTLGLGVQWNFGASL